MISQENELLLILNSRDFEYDIYTLIKAFYPGRGLRTVYEECGRQADTAAFSLLQYEEESRFYLRRPGTGELITRSAVRPKGDRTAVRNSIKQLIYRTLSETENREQNAE